MVAPHQQVTGDAERYYRPSDSVGNVPPDNVVIEDREETPVGDLEKGESSAIYDDADPQNHAGVDIEYAKHEFEGLRRRYSEISRTTSRHSQISHRLSQSISRRSRKDVEEPLEEDVESEFDVESVLRGRKKRMDEEEFRPKQIGMSTRYGLLMKVLCSKISLCTAWVVSNITSKHFQMPLLTFSMSMVPLRTSSGRNPGPKPRYYTTSAASSSLERFFMNLAPINGRCCLFSVNQIAAVLLVYVPLPTNAADTLALRAM